MLHLIKNTIYPLNCKLLTYLNFKITFHFNFFLMLKKHFLVLEAVVLHSPKN